MEHSDLQNESPLSISKKVAAIQSPDDVLSVADMIVDICYYTMLLDTRTPTTNKSMYNPESSKSRWAAATPQTAESTGGYTTGKEALPGVYVPTTKRRRVRTKNEGDVSHDGKSIPPSIIHAFRMMIAKEVHTSIKPVFSPATGYKIWLTNMAWKRRIQDIAMTNSSASDAILSLKANETAINQLNIPFSDVTHENVQLRWGRTSLSNPKKEVRSCIRGSECEALKLVSHQGPLGEYLTLGQQREFDKTGTLPTRHGQCLLCIRRIACCCWFNGKNNTVGIDTHNTRPFILPLFNTVDVPGGYKRQCMITTEDAHFISGPIVLPSTKLTVEKCPVNVVGYNGWYVDQRALIYMADEAVTKSVSTLN